MAGGLIGVGATYRDRALSGIVAESGLAQKRELASQAFKQEKTGEILSLTEKGIMTVIKQVAAAFGVAGMVPEQQEKMGGDYYAGPESGGGGIEEGGGGPLAEGMD